MGEGGAEQRQAGGGSAKEHIMRLRLHQRRRKRVSRGRSRGSQHKRVSEGRSARVGSDCARVGAEWSGWVPAQVGPEGEGCWFQR